MGIERGGRQERYRATSNDRSNYQEIAVTPIGDPSDKTPKRWPFGSAIVVDAAESPHTGTVAWPGAPARPTRFELLTCTFLYLDVTCQKGLKSFRIWRGRRGSNPRPLP